MGLGGTRSTSHMEPLRPAVCRARGRWPRFAHSKAIFLRARRYRFSGSSVRVVPWGGRGSAFIAIEVIKPQSAAHFFCFEALFGARDGLPRNRLNESPMIDSAPSLAA